MFVTVVGNLVADPELRFTPSGAAVANFTVASTPRRYNSTTQQWEDGEALFLRCSLWRDYAEHVAESLTRGTNVIVQGRLKQRSFETRDGEKRTVVELDVDEIGPTLRYAVATVTKVKKVSHDSHRGQQKQSFGQQRDPDPWGSQPNSPAKAGFDNAPF